MQDEIRDLLYASFDQELNEQEKKKLDDALKHSHALQQEHQEVVRIRKQASQAGEASFKPFFADRVMERLSSLKKKDTMVAELFETLKRAFKPVAVGAALACLVLLFFNIREVTKSQVQDMANNSPAYLEEVFDQITWQTLEGEL